MTTVRSAIISLDDPDARQLELVGGKGANLAEMTQMGIPVPPGFTISTQVCTHFTETNAYPSELRAVVEGATDGQRFL